MTQPVLSTALRRIVCTLLLLLSGALLPATAADIGTGDPVIDEAQLLLVRITSGKESLSDAKLTEALSLLFARPAFEGIREEGWRYMLFTLVKTRQLVEQYGPRYADARQRAGLAQVAQSMLRLQGELVTLYGPKFSLEAHLQRYPQSRDAFTQNLPTPPQAPNTQYFNRFDLALRDIHAQLKNLGMVAY